MSKPTGSSDSQQIRVLHLNAGNLYGGVETILTTLARRGHLCPDMESHFACCYEGRLSRELKEAGVPVYLLGDARMSRPWTAWRARRRLRRILREQQFEAVICHMPWNLVMFGSAVRDTGHKAVFWAHGIHTGQGWLERRAKRIVPDAAIANSRYTEKSLSNLWPGIETTVLYAPLALKQSPGSSTRIALRREFGCKPADTVIIQVSRLEEWKGHLLHLRALALLKDLAGWNCWFVGGAQNAIETAYLEQLRNTAAELGLARRVRFLGQRSDVGDLLSAADVFCQPNQAPEPFGIVFLEALQAKLPVVTTAMGGALEIVDESCGLLTKPADPSDLADSLRLLVGSKELRERLGEGGPERVRLLSDPATQMRALYNLSSKIAGVNHS